MKRILLIAVTIGLAIPAGLLQADKVKPPADFPDSPPESPLLKPATLPPSVNKNLENGLAVMVVTSQEIPWVSVTFYSTAGAKYDPPDKSGLAATASELLRQGTAKHSSDELAEELDFYAIKLGGSAGHELAYTRIGSLAKDVDRALGFLAEVVRTPTFPDREVKRHLAQTISGLKVAEADGGYWVGREFSKRVYGDHYLARQSNGTSETLPELNRDDLDAFHKAHYLPNGSTLIFSGAIEPDQAFTLAQKHFGDWAPGKMPEYEVAQIPAPEPTHIFLVDRPNSTQSNIRVGHVGFKRDDPRYPAAQVFNQVFGGSFNSRLNSKVRVEEGLTYGARGSFSFGKEPGTLSAGTFTKNVTTTETVTAVLSVMESMRTEEPNAEELGDAQSSITGRFGLSLETPQQVAGKVFDLTFYGLPGDYYETYLGQINKLTASNIISFAREAVDMSKLTVIVVGNAEEIKEGLEEVAPVTVVKLESDKPVD
ncbi:MAG: insulinase family protein [bacterium]|nr:insulinase family protein [bacterium]